MTAETAARPRPLTKEDIETLDTLALWTPPADGIPFIAAALAWPGFTIRERDDAWGAFQEAMLILETLGTGERAWFEYRSEYALPPGPSKQEAAIELACNVADEARNHFVFGGPR